MHYNLIIILYSGCTQTPIFFRSHYIVLQSWVLPITKFSHDQYMQHKTAKRKATKWLPVCSHFKIFKFCFLRAISCKDGTIILQYLVYWGNMLNVYVDKPWKHFAKWNKTDTKGQYCMIPLIQVTRRVKYTE